MVSESGHGRAVLSSLLPVQSETRRAAGCGEASRPAARPGGRRLKSSGSAWDAASGGWSGPDGLPALWHPGRRQVLVQRACPAPPSASAPALRRRMPGVCEDSEALRAARQDATVESAVAVLDATAASGAVDNSAWGSARRVKSLRAGDGRASRCSRPVKVALPAQARGLQPWDKTPRSCSWSCALTARRSLSCASRPSPRRLLRPRVGLGGQPRDRPMPGGGSVEMTWMRNARHIKLCRC
jgi:hypothetical protein